MATVSDRMHDSTVGVVRRTWTALRTRLDRRTQWLAVAAYGVIYAVLLVGAAIVAGYLGMVMVVFFTSYLTLVVAARQLVIRAIDATGGSYEANVVHAIGGHGVRLGDTPRRRYSKRSVSEDGERVQENRRPRR